MIKINQIETIRIDILNPKAKSFLKNLADLNLIKIKKDEPKSDLKEVLEKLRTKSDEAPSIEEITSEVETVRKEKT